MYIFATAAIFLVCCMVVQPRSSSVANRQMHFIHALLKSPEETESCICSDGLDCINPNRKCKFGSYVDTTCNFFLCYKGPGEDCDGKNDKCDSEYTCICNLCIDMKLKKKLSTFECITSLSVMVQNVLRHRHGKSPYCD